MGKNKYIETPERMWELFEEYKANLKPREIQKATPKGVVSEWHKPPLTLEGFYNYCARTVGCAKQYFFNQDELYSDYITICSRIKDEIRQDQIEGGMIGQYNASITQRLNNLTERIDQTTQGEKITGIDIRIINPDED